MESLNSQPDQRQSGEPFRSDQAEVQRSQGYTEVLNWLESQKAQGVHVTDTAFIGTLQQNLLPITDEERDLLGQKRNELFRSE